MASRDYTSIHPYPTRKRSKMRWNRVPVRTIVLVPLLLALAVACEESDTTPVSSESSTAARVDASVPQEPLVPGDDATIVSYLSTAAVTIQGFYYRNAQFDCPAGGGTCSVGPLIAKCLPGDVPMAGSAFRYRTSEGIANAFWDNIAGLISPNGYRTQQPQISEDFTLLVRVTCVDL